MYSPRPYIYICVSMVSDVGLILVANVGMKALNFYTLEDLSLYVDAAMLRNCCQVDKTS